MKKQIKNSIINLKSQLLFRGITNAFEKRYKNINQELFKQNISKENIKRYIKKWEVFEKKVEVNTFNLCYNLSGKLDFNIIPENIFAAVIEPKLNNTKELAFFEIKNFYTKFFENKRFFPKAFFHRIDRIYYDSDFHLVSDIDSFLESSNLEFPIILKASRDTFGGVGVRIINDKHQLKEKIDEFEYFVCQELIKQNEWINKINSSSLNTIRTCLYRSATGEISILNNSMRFGVNGSLDNETSGGIVCNLDEEGNFNEYAVDKFANKFFAHPNSNIQFKGLKVPFFSKLKNVAILIAEEVPMCKLISLDMCLDEHDNWRCIEINLNGQTIRFAQYAGRSFFGDFTDEVIESIT